MSVASGLRPLWIVPGVALALLAAAGSARAQQDSSLPSAQSDLRTAPDDVDTSLVPALPEPDAAPKPAPKPSSTPKPARKARPRKANALPPVAPYAGAQRLGLRGGPSAVDAPLAGEPPAENPLPPGPTVAAAPVPPPRRRIRSDDAPFDPVGLQLGDIRATPYIDEEVGYASNPLSVSGTPKGSAFETTEVGLGFNSLWSRDELRGTLKAGYSDYVSTPAANGPFGSGQVDGRLDATRNLAFDAEGRFNVSQVSASSLGLGSTPRQSLLTESTYGATVGATQKFGDLSLGLHGAIDRTSYAQTLAGDDYNDFSLAARAAYRVSEAVSPFVELDLDTRRYDGGVNALGYHSDSKGIVGKAGVTLGWSQKLTGEFDLGYGERRYDDARLPGASAFLVDASLIWSPTALTTVTVGAKSALGDAIVAGASADVTRTYTIDVAHALTRQITLGAAGGYATDRYVGAAIQDHTLTLGARAEYHLNRDVVLKASATRAEFTSNQANSNYFANVFLLGLRLQR